MKNKFLPPQMGENQLAFNEFPYHEEYQLSLPKPSQYKYIDNIKELHELVLDDGRKPYPYQIENLIYVSEEGDFRSCIGDDTGLGKTISVCALIKLFKRILIPAVIVVKATLKIQWYWEIKETNKDLKIEIIKNKEFIPDDDTDILIVSYDNFKKIDWSEMGFKTLILDEVQQIANWTSQRTVSVVSEGKKFPYVIPTSATAAKNNAFELFSMFHMLDPKTFNNRKEFGSMCNVTGTKYGGINPYYQKKFEGMIKGRFIRHTREEVAPDLPKARKSHLRVQIGNSKATDALRREMEKFVSIKEAMDDQKTILKSADSEDYDGSAIGRNRMELNASMMRMRHIIGDAKVEHALEFIETFLTEQPDRKLTVFLHHKSVADRIMEGIRERINQGILDINMPHLIRGGMNEEERNQIVRACTINKGWMSNDPKDRLLLGSTLAAGEGINLQQCFDALMVERQFNPANEDQAAPGRFSRKGIIEGVDYIFITFLTAINTLDDWFEQTVSYKRAELKRTFGDKDDEEINKMIGDTIETSDEFIDIVTREGKKWLRKGN